MSAFCVFGITLDQCKKAAAKKVSTWDDKKKQPISMAEWSEKVDALALELFEKASRAKQISPAFDAPQFASDWISVADKTVKARSMKIMRRGKKVDEKGAPVLRKGKPVIGWIPHAA
jgi:hypothetical protein